ncbi:MAG TPA: helicase-associated domain-containing protein [Chloroflexia bacterium]|nr:helicase-associated domain-containing protein [Chloroflexia bacterium]
MKARKGGGELLDIALIPPDVSAPDDAAREALRQTLLVLKLPQLRALATGRGVVSKGSQRETLAPAILDSILDPAQQEPIIGALKSTERAVLALGLLLDWRRSPLAAGSLRRLLPQASPAAIENALAHLAETGLLLPHTALSSRIDPYYHLPAAVEVTLLPLLPALRAFSGDLPDWPAAPDARPPATPRALRKIEAVLGALAAGDYAPAEAGPRDYRGQPTWALGRWEVVGEALPAPARRTAAGQAPAGVQVAAGRPLLAGDGLARLRDTAGLESDEEATFFIHLLEALNLVRRGAGTLIWQPHVVDGLRAQPVAETLIQVITATMNLSSWSELDMVLAGDRDLALFRNQALHYAEPSHMRSEVGHIRQALFGLLGWLPVGAWYDADALLTYLQMLYPELPTTTGPTIGGWEQQTWWLARSDGNGGWQPLDRRSPPDWTRGLGRLAAAALRGPLSWLGLVEMTTIKGAPPRGEVTSVAGFRVTDVGAALGQRPPELWGVHPLPAGTAPDPARGPALRVQGSGERPLLALDPRAVPLEAQRLLSLMADLARADSDLLLYRLSADSIRRAYDAGQDAAGIQRVLTMLAGEELPAVRRRIEAWWGAYGRLRFYTGVALMRFNDDFTLAELLASTNLGSHLLYQFSPRLVALRNEGLTKLIGELTRSGHRPRVIESVAGGEAS